ncbi:MAG: hypothetical protein J5666_03870 [Bacilli bacterium]|nr:hypothetical protein [Bacilli bacterium]
MDIKNKNLALNMIFSFAIIIAVIMFPIGLFLEVSQTVVDGAANHGLTTVEMFKALIYYFENIDTYVGSEWAFFGLYIFVVAFFVCGIVTLIHSVFLIVFSIQGMVKPIETEKINNHLVQFSVTLLAYVSILLGLYFYFLKDVGSRTIGAGPIILIIDSACTFIIAAILHLGSESKRATANKVLDVITSAIAYVGFVLLFLGPVMVESQLQEGLIAWIPEIMESITNYASSSSSSTASVMIALEFSIFGIVLLAVAFSFIGNVLTNGFGVIMNRRRPANPDFAKSSIVKSSLWLGFTLLGGIILTITLSNVFEPTKITMAPTMIICIVLAACSLGLSIANKVIQDKNKPTPEAQETEVQQA